MGENFRGGGSAQMKLDVEEKKQNIIYKNKILISSLKVFLCMISSWSVGEKCKQIYLIF